MLPLHRHVSSWNAYLHIFTVPTCVIYDYVLKCLLAFLSHSYLYLCPGFDKLLIRLTGKDEVTPCVDYRDRMHGILIFFFRQFKEIWDAMDLQPRFRRTMLLRLKIVCGTNAFHYSNGRPYRKQKALFSGVGTSATDKVGLLFLLAHVLGHDAAILEPHYRAPILRALAHVQVIIIASSGLRSYTEEELKIIFDKGYTVIFRQFQSIRAKGGKSYTPKSRWQQHEYLLEF